MHILLIAADSPLGVTLQSMLARWGRHRVTTVTQAVSRWKSERHAKKTARRADADIIVDLRIPQLMASGEWPQPVDVQRTHWLAKVCHRADIPYLYLSDPRVFSGLLSHPYRELEAPDADDVPGSSLIEAEELIRATCDNHLVLRLGPLFAAFDRNLLTQVLASLSSQAPLAVDDLDQLCPVEASDAARVISGVLDQLDAGAEARGTFHYNSPDRTTAYGFAEAVLAAASQFIKVADDAIVRLEHDPERAARNWSLDCREIRDTFAIKQVAWRGFIGSSVKQYLAE